MVPAFGQMPQPPADGGNYPEPVDVPRYLPEATLAPKAMVATAHPLASRVGLEVLKDGGNAIDALVAVQMALNVVEPQSSGLGGGCFIVYHDAKRGETYCIDGREETPAEARRGDFFNARGRLVAEPLTGGLPVGVPGTAAAMWLAHGRWGKLPMARVLEPAIRLAEEGTGVTPRLRVAIAVHQKRFLRFPASKKLFLRDDGSVPEVGEVRKNPDLARTLRLLAEQGPKVFYEGEIATDVVKAVREAPFQSGKLSLDDLKGYRAVLREPLRFGYRGHEIVSAPPPGSGGLTLGLMLGALEKEGVKKLKPGSVAEIDLLARAGAVAFADRNAYLGDQDWCPDLDMRALLEPKHVKARREAARGLRPGERAEPGGKPAARSDGSPREEGEHTTHFSIIDAQRNVVSCTTTIEHGMGSAVVVHGRGFLLNNELTDFDLERTTGPNALDAERRRRRTALGDEKTVGGKRPRSSMTPVIVFRDGKPWLTTGSPGGSRIIGVVAQVLVNVIDHGMDVQEAINAPRVNAQNGPLSLEVLYPKRKGLEEALGRRGWKLQQQQAWYEAWGGAQGIRVRPDGTLEGGADPRREGAARGY
ncbi:MAG TPA: gamma-glutamyltransferase [Gemmataceae bacterium]|nr:gamma-glutamyltransferase [Gemmataceae bacterium]